MFVERNECISLRHDLALSGPYNFFPQGSFPALAKHQVSLKSQEPNKDYIKS